MIDIIRTDSENPDFIELVANLDEDLKERDGEDHSFYAQFNKKDQLRNVVLTYLDERPIGCGAFKEHSPKIAEIKRMFTSPEYRGKGIAKKILTELEKWAFELSYENCVLETGKRQPEAIGLYKKCGYNLIPNYGQYADIENSLCFKKKLLK